MKIETKEENIQVKMMTNKKSKEKYIDYPFSYPQNLPKIEVSKTKHINDFEVEREYVCVRGYTMDECHNEFMKIKKRENETH